MRNQVTLASWQQGTDLAAEIIRNQVTLGKGYIHELGEEGMTKQLAWAVEPEEEVYLVRWGREEWVTNIKEVTEELRREWHRGKQGRDWKTCVGERATETCT